ncbi:WXG100 family type VII secretion target [Nocardia sp. NBC_01329]|uniref:WXG100 family type VII secretion target n=2 Tax=Nocardia TaxID=1817 RepID=UPI002E0DD781|nr:WXG100 family type VII secretion target [Nocardia sp. NBC_01329]
MGGPLGGGYRVNLTELEAAGDRLGNLIGFLEDCLDQIEKRVGVLRQGWSGEAATAYDDAHADWLTGVQDMKDGLLRMQEAARTAHTNYTSAAQTNVAMLGRGPAPGAQ